MHKSTRKLPKLVFSKGRGTLGLILAILLPFLTYFSILPFANQTLGQTPQTTISMVNKNYPGSQLIGYPNGNDVTAEVKVNNVTDTDGLAGFAFKISYDSNLVSIVDSNGDGKADTGTVIAGSLLLIWNTAKNWKAIWACLKIQEYNKLKEYYGKKFSYAPVILLSWVLMAVMEWSAVIY